MIESVIDQVTSLCPPVDRPNMAGFVTDIHEFLTRARWCRSYTVDTLGPANCMITATAVLNEEVDTLQSVAFALKHLWVALSYHHFEASSVDWYRAATVLRFVTVNRTAGYCVTGRIRATGGPYAELADVRAPPRRARR